MALQTASSSGKAAVLTGPNPAKLPENIAELSAADPSLVKYGAELLSHALQSSSPESAAESERSATRAGRSGNEKMQQASSTAVDRQKGESRSGQVNPDQVSVEQPAMTTPSENVVDELTTAAGTAEEPVARSGQSQQSLRHSRSEKKHGRKSRSASSVADLIDLTDA